ncbi:TIGR03089 family protein [Rhodococcus sp. WMMA185]|uniref:TIGR03089 family protein n=1 Tax=Rhodococcus sp. WMMA185 TaxID=679318 RepID=UPI000878BEEB|nr:TIGR03089 family protein [Rhodococcus sp. WMMA185]AOW92210.1 TIGR03089 family protein [Rhodococcus sp. WMMA185]
MNHASRTLTDALLDPILKDDPAGPRVTFYDDATGERVELSAVTLANWAAKTANLLRDEFALEPGARVVVLLPAHWQTAAVLLGAWWAGAEVVLDPDLEAEVALITGPRLSDVEDVPDVAALSLDAFGRPIADLPLGITDYATSVRAHGDQFRPTLAGPALAGKSVDEVLAAAQASAAARGISGGDRVLSESTWDSPDALIDGLIAIFAAGASLVQVANPDAAAQSRRVDSEKITLQLAR